MNVQSILVPVDFSPCSKALVAEASDLAGALGAQLRLLHVVEPVEGLPAQALIRTAQGLEPAEAALIAEAEAGLEAYEVTTVPVERGVRIGKPVEQILAAAKELDADMVMLGTHGRRGLAHLLLGSVAERVVRLSPVPVLTVRSTHRPECDSPGCDWCAVRAGAVRAQASVETDG